MECGSAAWGVGRSCRTSKVDSIEMLVGCGAQGGKMAAWQKAQVASLCTGVGSDSRGVPMVEVEAVRVAGRCCARLAPPRTSGRAMRSSRSNRPVRIG